VFALPGKAVSEMTYTVLGRALNPPHSLTDDDDAARSVLL